MTIAALLENQDEVYFSDEFNKVIEDHLTHLRTNNIQIADITNTQAVKFNGDFYGLLTELLIRKVYHYPIMRVNSYLSPADFNGKYYQVIMPDLQFIDRLKAGLETV